MKKIIALEKERKFSLVRDAQLSKEHKSFWEEIFQDSNSNQPILIIVDKQKDKEAIETTYLQSVQVNKASSKPLYIDLQDLDHFYDLMVDVAVNDGSPKQELGPLGKVLSYGGILVINYDQASSSVVETLSPLYDTTEEIQKRFRMKLLKKHGPKNKASFKQKDNLLTGKISIIGLISTQTLLDQDRYSSAFYSRFSQIKKYLESNIINIPNLMFNTNNPSRYEKEIDLGYSPFWKEELIGKISLTTKDNKQIIEAKPGSLVTWLNEHKYESREQIFYITNPPIDPEFKIFIQETLITKQIIFHEKPYSIPDNLKIWIQTTEYSKENQKTTLNQVTKPQDNYILITSYNFDALSTSYFVRDGMLLPNLPWFGQKNLCVCTSLKPYQWYKLMNEQSISLSVLPNVSIPENFSLSLEKIDKEESCFSHTELTPTQYRDILITSEELNGIISSDTNVTLTKLIEANKKLVEENKSKNLFIIDMSPANQAADIIQSIFFESDLNLSIKSSQIYEAMRKPNNVIVFRGLSYVPKLYAELRHLFQKKPVQVDNGKLKQISANIIVLETTKELIEPDYFDSIKIDPESMCKEYYSFLGNLEFDKFSELMNLSKDLQSIEKFKSFHYLYNPGYLSMTKWHQISNLANHGKLARDYDWYKAVKKILLPGLVSETEVHAYANVRLKLIFKSQSHKKVHWHKLWPKIQSCHKLEDINKKYWELLNDLSLDHIQEIYTENTSPSIKTIYPESLASQLLIIAQRFLQEQNNIEKEDTQAWLNYYKKLWTVNHRSVKSILPKIELKLLGTESSMEKQINDCVAVLNVWPALCIKGPPGSGKSYAIDSIIKELIGINAEPAYNARISVIDQYEYAYKLSGYKKETDDKKYSRIKFKDVLKEWATCKDPGFKLLIIEEANLSITGFWNILGGLFDREGYQNIWIDGNAYSLNQYHKVIFVGNQDHLPGRNYQPVVNDLSVTVQFPGLTLDFLQQNMVDKMIEELVQHKHSKMFLSPRDKDCMLNIVVDLLQIIKPMVSTNVYSPRNLAELIIRIITTYENSIEEDSVMQNNRKWLEFVFLHFMTVCGGELSTNRLIAFQEYVNTKYGILLPEPCHSQVNDIFKGPKFSSILEELNCEKFRVTNSVKELAKYYDQFLKFRAKKIELKEKLSKEFNHYGKNVLLVQGPSARGKDIVLDIVLKARGFYLEGSNNKSKETEKIYYRINGGFSLKLIEQAIEKAVKTNSILVISELNLVKIQHIENRLNHMLSDNAGSGFSVIATINPDDYEGRQVLSQAFLDRSCVVHIEDYTEEEYKQILELYAASKDEQETLYTEYNQKRNKSKQNPSLTPNLRNLIKKTDEPNYEYLIDHLPKETFDKKQICSSCTSELSMEQSFAQLCLPNMSETEIRKYFKGYKYNSKEKSELSEPLLQQVGKHKWSRPKPENLHSHLYNILEHLRIRNCWKTFLPRLCFKTDVVLSPLEQTIKENKSFQASVEEIVAAFISLLIKNETGLQRIYSNNNFNKDPDLEEIYNRLVSNQELIYKVINNVPASLDEYSILQAALKAQKYIEQLNAGFTQIANRQINYSPVVEPQESDQSQETNYDSANKHENDTKTLLQNNDSPNQLNQDELESSSSSSSSQATTSKQDYNIKQIGTCSATLYFPTDCYSQIGCGWDNRISELSYKQDEILLSNSIGSEVTLNTDAIEEKYNSYFAECLVPFQGMARITDGLDKTRNLSCTMPVIVKPNEEIKYTVYQSPLSQVHKSVLTEATQAQKKSLPFSISYYAWDELNHLVQEYDFSPLMPVSEQREFLEELLHLFRSQTRFTLEEKATSPVAFLINPESAQKEVNEFIEKQEGSCLQAICTFFAIIKDKLSLPALWFIGYMSHNGSIANTRHCWVEIYDENDGVLRLDPIGLPASDKETVDNLKKIKSYVPLLEPDDVPRISVKVPKELKVPVFKYPGLMNLRYDSSELDSNFPYLFDQNPDIGDVLYSATPGRLNVSRLLKGVPKFYYRTGMTLSRSPKTLIFTGYPNNQRRQLTIKPNSNEFMIEEDFWQHLMETGANFAVWNGKRRFGPFTDIESFMGAVAFALKPQKAHRLFGRPKSESCIKLAELKRKQKEKGRTCYELDEHKVDFLLKEVRKKYINKSKKLLGSVSRTPKDLLLEMNLFGQHSDEPTLIKHLVRKMAANTVLTIDPETTNSESESSIEDSTSITGLYISNCQIKPVITINHTNASWLESLSLYDIRGGLNNNLNITLSNLPVLSRLEIRHSRLDSLRMKNLPLLAFASFRNSSIEEIDLSSIPELKQLDISFCKNLKKLSFSSIKKLHAFIFKGLFPEPKIEVTSYQDQADLRYLIRKNQGFDLDFGSKIDVLKWTKTCFSYTIESSLSLKESMDVQDIEEEKSNANN